MDDAYAFGLELRYVSTIFLVFSPYCGSSFVDKASKSRNWHPETSPEEVAKNVYSSSFHPIIRGLFMDIAGAEGLKG
jgi:hypothetical protein